MNISVNLDFSLFHLKPSIGNFCVIAVHLLSHPSMRGMANLYLDYSLSLFLLLPFAYLCKT